MDFKKRKFSLYIGCMFIMQSLISSVRNKKMNGNEFLCQLRNNNILQGKYMESRDTQEVTVFKITGVEVEVEKFCQMYESMHGKSDLDDVVSVITIRDIHVHRTHCPEAFMQNFIQFIQDYLIGKNDRRVQNTLGLSIDCVKRAHIKNLSQINTHLELVYRVHHYVYKYCIASFHDFCFNAIADLIVYHICLRFETHFDFFITRDQTEDALNEFCKLEFEVILEKMRNGTEKISLNDVSEWGFKAPGSAFDLCYERTCKYEKELGVEFFCNNEADLLRLCNYLCFYEFEEIFGEGINDLLQMYLKIFEMEASRESFKKHYLAICHDLLELHKIKKPTEKYYYNKANKKYFKNLKFAINIQNFLIDIQAENIRVAHVEKFQSKLDEIHKNLSQENVTRIVLNRVIKPETLKPLCDALQRFKVFDVPHRNQTVYIDLDRGMSDLEAKACSEKCEKIFSERSADVKTVEISAIIKQNPESVNPTSSQSLIKKTEITSTGGKSNTHHTITQQYMNDTKITIRKWNKEKTKNPAFQRLWNKCMTNSNSTQSAAYIVTITNNNASSHILILQHTKKAERGKSKIMTTLIYDMPNACQQNEAELAENCDRYIRCFNDVSDLFLRSLLKSLQCAQLLGKGLLKIPNHSILRSNEYIYSEYIFNVLHAHEVVEDNYNHLDLCYTPKRYKLSMVTLPIKEIMNFDRLGKYDSQGFYKVLEYLSISEKDFNDILVRFAFNNNFSNETIDDQNIEDKCGTFGNIVCYLSFHFNFIMMMHLRVRKSSFYTFPITINPFKNLSEIIDFAATLPTINKLESLWQKTDCEVSFLMTVITDICKRTKYAYGSNGLRNYKLKKEDVYDIIKHHIKNLQDTSKRSSNADINNKLPASDLQHLESICNSTRPEREIFKLAAMISEDLIGPCRLVKIRTASFKFRRSNDFVNKTKDAVLDETDEQYEDLGGWNDHVQEELNY